MQAIENFLSKISTMTKTAQKYSEDIKSELAPDFLALDFLRRDELGLSRILANLLDPKGSHGQGPVFLELFLQQFWPEMIPHASNARVKCEATTSRGRKMDIKVDLTPRSAMVIESKIWWAGDQAHQIKDYLEELKSNCDLYRVLYLTPVKGTRPSKHSIDESLCNEAIVSGRLTLPGPTDLRTWVKECISACQSFRVRSFLDELLLFINKRIIGEVNMSNSSKIAEQAVMNKENLRAAMDIAGSLDSIRRKAFQEFIKKLSGRESSIAIPEGWELTLDPNIFDTAHSNISLTPRPREDAKYSVVVNFGRKELGDVAVGIRVLLPVVDNKLQYDHKRDAQDLYEAIQESPINKGKLDLPWWVCWYKFPKYDDWRQPDAVVAMVDDDEGGMVNLAITELNEVISFLEDKKLLSKFVK